MTSSAFSRGVIGPNAVLQLSAVLRVREGEGAARRLFRKAGVEDLLDNPPGEMVDEVRVARLYDALFDLPRQAGRAEAIAAEAGARTATYILAHRIPAPVKRLLRLLPAPLAARLLLKAVEKNAWTFAGSGRVSIRLTSPLVLEIEGNPLMMPGCVWHQAVLETLFQRLVSPRARVRHVHCPGLPGESAEVPCRFEIEA